MAEAYIEETQKILGAIIKKPKLTEKLLSKPPFRFIQDITKSVIQETGYLNGVYTDDELNAENQVSEWKKRMKEKYEIKVWNKSMKEK